MAVHNEHDDYHWVFSRNLRRSLHGEEEPYRDPPRLGEALVELSLTLGGFVGVILLISAVLGAFR